MKALMRAFLKGHVWLYRTSKGRLGSMKDRVVLLTTTGRKSGAARTVPLMAIRDDGCYLVAASAGGDRRNPGWYYNLVDDPAVTLQDRDQVMTATARVADGDEYTELWQRFEDMDDRFRGYQEKAARQIPVVIVETA